MTTKAIILKKQNTNEYDQLVTCYTEDFGKLTAIAKSILKPNSIQALHLDTFNLAEFELINGRGMPIITGAQTADSYLGIKSSIIKTAVAYFFIEVLDKMVLDNDKDEKLWSFLLSFLGELDGNNSNPMTLFRQGQARLLGILGYFPETNYCKECSVGLNNNNFGAYNYVLGGIICKHCFLDGYGGILINHDDFLLFRPNLNTDPDKSKDYRRSILDGMFEYISGNKFSSLELLNMIK